MDNHFSWCEGGPRLDQGTQHLCPGIRGHSTFFWLTIMLFPFAMTALLAWWGIRRADSCGGECPLFFISFFWYSNLLFLDQQNYLAAKFGSRCARVPWVRIKHARYNRVRSVVPAWTGRHCIRVCGVKCRWACFWGEVKERVSRRTCRRGRADSVIWRWRIWQATGSGCLATRSHLRLTDLLGFPEFPRQCPSAISYF